MLESIKFFKICNRYVYVIVFFFFGFLFNYFYCIYLIGMYRLEVICEWCGLYIGYVFNDGFVFMGFWYCMNFVVMLFVLDYSNENYV